MKISRPATIWIPVLTLSLMASCNRPDGASGSDGKSLDNFANGGVRQYNSCTPNAQSLTAAKDTIVSASTQEARAAVTNALSAVPQPFLRAFQAAGGQVVATRDAAKICDRLSQNNSEKDLEKGTTIPSCWIQEKIGEAPKIYLSDDPKLIQHSTIRAFTYFFTEYFVTRINHPDVIGRIPQSAQWQTGIKEFENQRDAVTVAFLRDLDNKKPAAASVFRNAYNRDPLKFKNAVLAEVLDSCYCSDSTRSVMRKEFPITWSVSQCRAQ